MKRKIVTFLIIFFGSFLVFSWNFWQKIFFEKQKFFQYNYSLFLAQNRDFSGALQYFPENFWTENEAFRLELRGDLEYKISASTGATLDYYYAAKNFATNENLEQKIAFLEGKIFSENGENFPEKNSETPTENPEKSEEIQQKEVELEQTQAERKNFLNPYRTQESHLQDEISRFKNLISENNLSAERDW